MGDQTVFPSKEWFEQYQVEVNNDEEYAESSKGWGVDFNGDFIFKMTDMPLSEVDIDAMPEELQDQLDQYISETDTEGHVGMAFVGLEDGECTDAILIESEDEVDNGFKLTGTYDNWVELIRGNVGAVDGMMSGKFELDGDMQKVLQYSDSATQLTESATAIDAVFAHEEFPA